MNSKKIINFAENKNEWLVKTPTGWEKFEGVAKIEKKRLYQITTNNNKKIIVSGNHAFLDENNKKLLCRDSLNKYICTEDGIEKVIELKYYKKDFSYDLVNVSGGNVFYSNKILNHNTYIVEKFWESVYPIISSSKKSKIFIASTPNGTDNLFYRLYQGALQGENNWKAERIDWWEIPGRDEKWKSDTVRTLGSQEIFDQEFGNQFLQGGESSVDEALYNKMQTDIREPELVFDEGKYIVFDEPKENRIYAVGVDVSEGVGEAASVVQVLDITDLTSIEQVAVFHDRNIIPFQFTTKLLEILNQWGRPPVLIERNNCGAQVVEQLKFTHGYENIVSWGAKAGDKTEYKRVGILAHTNTKYRGIQNMRYWINELRVVRIRDAKTLHEFKNFIRFPNNTWGARPGSDSWDDRVMAFVWVLMILENEICTRYFDIVKLDDCDRPFIIKPLDYGIRGVVSPLQLYTNEKDSSTNNALPTILNAEDNSTDIDDMRNMGWRFPDEPNEGLNNTWQPL